MILPQLSVFQAVGATFAVAATFVGLLYALPGSILSLPRDNSKHILARAAMVILASCIAVVPAYSLLSTGSGAAPLSHLLGVAPACNSPEVVLRGLGLVMLLFAGPLVSWGAEAASQRLQQQADRGLIPAPTTSPWLNSLLHDRTQLLISFRTFVLAPVTEEWCYRACTIPLLVAAGIGHGGVIATTCAAFALSHAHHYRDKLRQGLSPSAAAAATALQLSYTGVFGALMAHVYLRTGSTLAIIAPHTFCNVMGLPSTAYMQPWHPLYPYRHALAAALAGGIVAFFACLITGAWIPAAAKLPCALQPAYS